MSGLPGKVCGEREREQAESERSWRHLSDGTPCLTTGRTEFVETAGSSLLSERGFATQRFLTTPYRREGFLLFYYRLVTGVCLAVIKLTALLGCIHAPVNL